MSYLKTAEKYPFPVGADVITPAVPKILKELIAAAADLRWCHWKSNVRLVLSVQGRTDLDLLVHPEDEEKFFQILRAIGFVEFLAMPYTDYCGVTNWLGADLDSGILLHIHLHNRLLTGMKSVKEQDLPWLGKVLNARTPDAQTGLPIIPRALEAHILLAREVAKSNRSWRMFCRLRGRCAISRANRDEMVFLFAGSSAAELDHWGQQLWGEDPWSVAREAFAAESWHTRAGLARITAALDPVLAQWARPFLPALFGRIRGGVIKRLMMLRLILNPTAPRKMLLKTPAPLVAFVGSDGAGKSTVTSDSCRWLSWKADVKVVYFGSKDKALRGLQRRLGNFPRTGKAAQREGKREKPTLRRALRSAYAAHLRLRSMQRCEKMRARGQFVIADRFPQTEVRGTYDGPRDIDLSSLSGIIRWCYAYEARAFKALTQLKPDLIIRLVVPVDVALARKPDHDTDGIARKIELTRSLRFGGAPSIEVDAAQPLEDVLLQVRRALWAEIRRSAED